MRVVGKDRCNAAARRILAVGLAVALAGGVAIFSRAQAVEREYTFSPDPQHALLKLSYLGSTSGARTELTLFADGRLLMESAGRVVWESLEVELTVEQVDGLIARAVSAGLMEYDEDRMFREMANLPRLYPVHDAGIMELEIQLPSYRGPGQLEAAPAKKLIRLQRASSYAERFPEIEELQGIIAIENALRTFKNNARKARNEK